VTASRLDGTWFVVPTPFGEDGALDLDDQRRLVEAPIAWGVDGLTVMGVTSEAAALSPEERDAALDVIFRAAGGRVPIAVGCSAGGVAPVVSLARRARDLGAVGAMVSAPPLFRNPELLPEFYARVAREAGLPLVIQDEPAATGVVIPVGILLRCLRASGQRTVKLEDPPTPPKVASLLEADPDLGVFGGLGGVSALGELRRGACGTMTGFAYPEILAAVRHALLDGDPALAAGQFELYLPLIQFEAQPGVGLAIRKELLRRRGVIRTNVTRGPFSIDPATAEELDGLLDRLGVTPSPERFAVA
jgi:4-hydroxy-tetrahydrodipicolinate synthase